MGGGNIKVVVRCRPLNSREIARGAKCLIRMEGDQTFITRPDANDPGNSKVAKRDGVENVKSFTFDKSYWSFDKNDSNYATQAMLYNDLGEEFLDYAFEGYNTCIFAYGQTSAGKSYSMMGYGENKGIIPLTCCELFNRINNNQDSEVTYQVQVSYIEIYNERVRDLLNPKNKGNLKVREHPALGPYVEDLSKLIVNSFNDIENLMDEGNKARTVAATNMNETSSRSHVVFTLLVTQKRHDTLTNMDTEKVARISLVDLAGSERVNSTGATGARLKEGANINKSLTTLGKVIAALAEQSSTDKKKGKKEIFVPYRDSVLTWLLKDSLGGNSKTAMIAAISPADYDETLSTLRYADATKRIKNKAVVNEDPNARLIRELKEELQMFRSKIGGDGTFDSSEPCDSSVPPSQQVVVLQDKNGNTIKKMKKELIDQMQASEKLMEEVNESWMERIRKTKKIQKEREETLEKLGIMIEKNNIGVHPPKKVPHLVNLNEDPLLSECLVYQIKPGKTRVGRLESDIPVDIRLSGENIIDEHCYFENMDGSVTLHPHEDSTTMVNGMRINKQKKLKSGYRIILGDFHVFRFNNPEEVRRERAKSKQLSISISGPITPNGNGEDSAKAPDSPTSTASLMSEAVIDWNFARRELAINCLNSGSDTNLNTLGTLPDEYLQRLMDDLKKIQSARRTPRPDSRNSDCDDNFNRINKTINNSSSPKIPASELEDGLKVIKEEMQQQFDLQKQEYEEKIRSIEALNVELKAEKTQMEEKLQIFEKEIQMIQSQGYQRKFSYNPKEEEEWIKRIIEDEDINYYEYSNFNKIEKIDEGGFDVVNKAETNNKKQVVLKGFIEKKISKIDDDDVIKKFVKELKLFRTIGFHDNINSFLGITKDHAGNCIMVLEYANGGNLRDYLKEKFDSLKWENKIQMALDVTCGLKYLHSKVIIHGDLHSKNILVNNDRLLIADFRLAKKITEASSNSTENRIGIIEYVDPQCYKNINYKRDKKSDIYSLGVLLWEITSGHPPFHDFSRDVIERDILRYHISHLNLREQPIEGTPSRYKQLYQHCWNDDPKKRPDINQVYDEILNQSSQFNADVTNKQREDSLEMSNSNSLKYNPIKEGG